MNVLKHVSVGVRNVTAFLKGTVILYLKHVLYDVM